MTKADGKKKILRVSENISYRSGEEIISILKGFSERFNIPLSDINLVRDYDSDYCKVTFEGYSLETDEEFESRLDAERRLRETTKHIKLKQYEQLKKELGL